MTCCSSLVGQLLVLTLAQAALRVENVSTALVDGVDALPVLPRISGIFLIASGSRMTCPLPSGLKTVTAPASAPFLTEMIDRVASITSMLIFSLQPPHRSSTFRLVPMCFTGSPSTLSDVNCSKLGGHVQTNEPEPTIGRSLARTVDKMR